MDRNFSINEVPNPLSWFLIFLLERDSEFLFQNVIYYNISGNFHRRICFLKYWISKFEFLNWPSFIIECFLKSSIHKPYTFSKIVKYRIYYPEYSYSCNNEIPSLDSRTVIFYNDTLEEISIGRSIFLNTRVSNIFLVMSFIFSITRSRIRIPK